MWFFQTIYTCSIHLCSSPYFLTTIHRPDKMFKSTVRSLTFPLKHLKSSLCCHLPYSSVYRNRLTLLLFSTILWHLTQWITCLHISKKLPLSQKNLCFFFLRKHSCKSILLSLSTVFEKLFTLTTFLTIHLSLIPCSLALHPKFNWNCPLKSHF